MTTRILGTLLLLGALASSAGAQGARIHLASAQVVADAAGRPALKLAADGPIAFAVEPEPDGAPAPADRLRLRLHGVTPTSGLQATPLAPFAVQAVAVGTDTVLTVVAPGLPPGSRLVVGTALRASDLTIVVR